MEVQKTLLEFISVELLNNSTTLQADDNLLEDGMVSSLGMLRLVTFVEETYKIKIPFEDLVIENFRTVTVLVKYLRPLV